MNFLNSIPQFIAKQSGMKRNLLACLFGALVAAALPPVYIFPLAILGFSGFFLMMLAAESPKVAFKIGWWFGFGHFTAGLYWIAFALLVDAESFAWLIPFAVFGIPAVIAFYIGFVSIVTWKISKYISGWRLIIAFACVWTLTEMLRGWLFTGFPWNLAGYVLSMSDSMLQLASVTGIWGLSLLVVIVCTMPASLVSSNRGYGHSYRCFLPFSISVLVMAAVFMGGAYRLHNAEIKFVPNVKVRIVQANIPQNMKWEDELRYESVRKYVEMSTSDGFDSITHVIWPETALPFIITENSPLLDEIAKAVPKNGAVITGSLHAEFTKGGFLGKMFNSLIVINSKGNLYSRYDKSHLVPFGEYVPFRTILPIEKITQGSMDFSEGEGVETINAPNFPSFSGLICYEVIFPGKVVDRSNPPKVIINVTNDAWYGNTSGPYQHFQMARVRAVEEGIPLIRSANNGISAVIDSYGRVVYATKLSTTAILDSPLPAENLYITTYGRFGAATTIIMVALMLLIVCKNAIIRDD